MARRVQAARGESLFRGWFAEAMANVVDEQYQSRGDNESDSDVGEVSAVSEGDHVECSPVAKTRGKVLSVPYGFTRPFSHGSRDTRAVAWLSPELICGELVIDQVPSIQTAELMGTRESFGV